jgi:hypothetical protein
MEMRMRDGGFGTSRWRRAADVCGWLSLFFWLLYIALVLGEGHLSFSGRIAGIAIWTFFASPFVGTLLALIAATGRRWWLALAAVWLAALLYELLTLSRHPFDL